MAIITRGRFKGKVVTLGQFANDWFTFEELGRHVISPLSVRLSPYECDIVRKCTSKGMLLELFELRPDGTFIRNNRQRYG